MVSQKQKVLQWIDRQTFSLSIDFQETMLNASISALELAKIDAERFSEAALRRFWNYFLEKTDNDEKRGLSLLFKIDESCPYRLMYIPRFLARSSDKRQRLKGLKLVTRPAMLALIDTFNDREYEALGCVMSMFAGAMRTKLTPRGNEGGVDFFASIVQPARCHLFSGTVGPLRIIGQTKRYGEPVSKGEMRDFITTINQIENRSPETEKHVPSWFRTCRGPLAGWFIAHHGLQSGAESLANDHGIIVSDSLDLAEIAALSRVLEYYNSADERATMLRNMVEGVLKNQ